MTHNIILIIGTLIFAPIIGGFISGFDRVITARLQGRVGPPLLQPFYDIFKLFGKERIIVNRLQVVFVVLYLFFAALAMVLFMLKGDLIVIVFIMAIGGSCVVIGALSSRAPYSQIGAHREIMQMLAYEPILLLMAVAFYLSTGGFTVQDVLSYDKPLLLELPLVFIAVGIALTIKMRKSPFDISASHHAHQEIVRGFLTDYSGPMLALIEIAHFFETVLVFGFLSLFWATNWWISASFLVEMFLLELVIDNIHARLTWQFMIKFTWVAGIGLSVINIAWLLFA